MIGYDYGGQYKYHEIKDYNICCTCQYFYDNWYETRFECLKKTQCDIDIGELKYGSYDNR